MAINQKIKALMAMRGKKSSELAEYLGLAHKQALTTKFSRNSFSADDLIKISKFLNCELSFIVSDTQKITLDESDIRQNKSERKK